LVGAAGQSITFSLVPAFLPSTDPGATAACPIGIQATATDGGVVLDNNQPLAVTVQVLAQLDTSILPVAFR
jgi:hypothetical protein